MRTYSANECPNRSVNTDTYFHPYNCKGARQEIAMLVIVGLALERLVPLNEANGASTLGPEARDRRSSHSVSAPRGNIRQH